MDTQPSRLTAIALAFMAVIWVSPFSWLILNAFNPLSTGQLEIPRAFGFDNFGLAVSGNAGIPLLKDIPLLGNLFSNQTRNGTRRELIVLITPYLINDSHEAETLTEAFRRTLGPWSGVMPAPIVPAKETAIAAPAGAPAAVAPAPAVSAPPASSAQPTKP